jgi:hypothetical protein
MAGEAVLDTLQCAWSALEPLGLPMAVIGGLALSAWRHVRYTRDADLLVVADDSRIDEILRALQNAGFHPRRSPPVLKIDEQKIIQFSFIPPERSLPFQLDVLLATSGYQEQALARRADKQLPGLKQPVQVLRPDDLILLKLIAGRIIDRADAAMLLRENRSEIDMPYLNEWIGKLGLTREFAEIWREAFPDDLMPTE